MNALFYLSSGILLGLASGLAPGPLFTLVITETLKHSKKEGIKISCAPLFTDLPIILLSVYLLAEISQFRYILGILSLAGGFFIGYLGLANLSFKGIHFNPTEDIPHSFIKGITTNFLNPHPYIFWITVGAPIMIKAYRISPLFPVFFLVGFLGTLVGSKIVITLIIERSKSLLNNNLYFFLIRFLGIVLILFALFLFKDSLTLLR